MPVSRRTKSSITKEGAARLLLPLFTLLISGCHLSANNKSQNAQVEIILDLADTQAEQNLANMLAAEPPAADLAEIFDRYNKQSIPAVTFTNW